MGELARDIRFALRVLVKNRAHTAIALVALALGVGANTAVFSVVKAVLLRPLPYSHPNQLVQIWAVNPKGSEGPVSPLDFDDTLGQSRTFESAALYQLGGKNLTGEGPAELAASARVSPSLFQVLGVQALMGRTFSVNEDKPTAVAVALLGFNLWRRHFGSDPAILGKTVHLDGKPYIVVGVMPPGFDFPYRRELWEPLELDPNERGNRLVRSFQAVARLREGVGLSQAQAEMNTVAGRLMEEYPLTDWNWGIKLVSLHEELVGDTRKPLEISSAAAGFVLLIACVSVANLLLAQLTARKQELAVRSALGADRARLVRQLLAESVLLAVAGGGLGLLLACWGINVLRVAGPKDIPRFSEISIDRWVLAFTFVVSTATGIAFGLAPALLVSGRRLNMALKEGVARSGQGPGLAAPRRAHGLLAASEVAMSLVLLIASGLLINSLWRLTSVDLGFTPDHVLSMAIYRRPPPTGMAALLKQTFFQRVLEEVRALPGVEAAALSSTAVVGGRWMNVVFHFPGRSTLAPANSYTAQFRIVSPDFFRVLGVRLLRGRLFTGHDGEQAPSVVVINQAMARRFWPNEDPIGKTVTDVPHLEGTVEVVGMVSDMRDVKLSAEAEPEMYASYLQAPSPSMTLLVRTASNPLDMAPAVRARVWAVDRDQPLVNVGALEDQVALSIAEPRFRAFLLGTFSGVGLILALVSLYGVVSHTVRERTAEIGVRMALGADRNSILKLFLREGLTLTLSGLGVGLVSAWGLTRFLAGMLYGVSPTDPATFLIPSLLLSVVAMAAVYFPARRATRVDPMVALRYE